MSDKVRIAVAGASGFVGRALVPALARQYHVLALARSVAGQPMADGVTWRNCDLFNLRAAEEALEGASVGVYLVHSMMPPARLTQARFDDLDLICADNFARACAAHGVRHIVYLGGLLPTGAAKLSRHLESRHEVEQTLAAYGVPVTTLRAGLIIGVGGSSFEMMTQLVRRLPVMVTPRWTSTLTQPIALEDVIPLLELAVAAPELAGCAYDIGGPDVLSYAEMLETTGRALGKRTRVKPLPVRTANLSLLWVSAITGAPQALVRPLVESLSHSMVVTDGGVLQKRAGQEAQSLKASIERALADGRRVSTTRETERSGQRRRSAPRTVCSIQRLPLGRGRDARWVAEEYMRWLPRIFRPLLHVTVEKGEICRFFLRPLSEPLLELSWASERSTASRQLFYVSGGLLVGQAAGLRPRLEFRTVLGGRYVLAAISDFVPRLPWLAYKFTQAIVHLLVMHAFGRHLAREGSRLASDTREAAADPPQKR